MLNTITAIKKRHQGHWFEPGSLAVFQQQVSTACGLSGAGRSVLYLALNTARASTSARVGFRMVR